MPSNERKQPNKTVDRLAIGVALAALLFGSYVVYARSVPDIGSLEELARASLLYPEDLHGRDIEFEADYFGHRYKGNTESLLDAYVIYFGAWEKYILFFLRDSAAAFEGRDTVFVDVGANSGLHSLFMSNHAGAVHAIEPYPPAVARIEDGVERNAITNIFVHPVGFGAEEAVLPFTAPPDDNFGVGSFADAEAGGNDLELRIVRGDDYLASKGVESVDLMKIDIEGYERPALDGLRKLLETSRPVVVMEITIDPNRDELFGSMDQLREAFPEDYEFFAFTEHNLMSGAYALGPLAVDFQEETQHDVIAVPAEKADRLPRASE